MKKILFISLALLLAACSTVQPVQQEQPAPVVATVLVTVVQPAEVSQPTAIAPAATEAPAEAPAPTEAPVATEAPAATAAPVSVGEDGVVNVDKALGKGIFEDIVISSDVITLNCTPREIQFTMKAAHPDVVRGEWYYRIINTTTFLDTEWFPMGRMGTDGNGNFSVELKATDINPDWRGNEKLFLDFQFVGVNKGGGVVGRTEHIEKMVTYYKECP